MSSAISGGPLTGGRHRGAGRQPAITCGPRRWRGAERQRVGYIFGLAGNPVLLRIARVEAGPQGADNRFIVTNLQGLPQALYVKVYCARGQAENLIKAHKLHLASDRTSCTKATANQFRLLIHTAAHWLMLSLRGLAPRTSFWRDAQFDTIRLCLVKVAGRVTERWSLGSRSPCRPPIRIRSASLRSPDASRSCRRD
jgi:hypothetical protein